MKESDTSFVGDKGEQLYRDLEDVPYDFDSMYPSIISESLKCVGQSKSCPPVYIGNSLLSSLAILMGNALLYLGCVRYYVRLRAPPLCVH